MSATNHEVLNNGRILSVTENGKPEQVKVRILPIRHLQRYAERVNDVAYLAELFCGKPEGWADTLSHESVYQIVEEGERLNQSPFGELLRRQKGRNVRLAQAAGVPVPTELTPTPPSPDSSPGPALPPA
jgi:hypothetical protein